MNANQPGLPLHPAVLALVAEIGPQSRDVLEQMVAIELVQAVLSRFPGAKIVGVTQTGLDQTDEPPDTGSEEERED